MELLTAGEMRRIEAAAIATGAATGAGLMERAGEGVVAGALAEWPELARGAHRALVLCGPGNNGGDGFVVARLLHARGWQVSVFLYGDMARLPPDARGNHDRWVALGLVRPLAGLVAWLPPEPFDLVVDALFGTGLARSVAGVLALIPSPLPARHRVAVDVPSGLSADTGRTPGGALAADLTVSFHRARCGHYLADGPEVCGALRVVDIGLPDSAPAGGCLVGPPAGLGKRAGHKYGYGHALILAGPAGQGGAARLAARAALRVGAGLVTVGAPAAAMVENAARLDAVMLRRVGDGADLAGLLADPRINALALGPGLGTDARAEGLVMAALDAARARRAAGGRLSLVLDADALTLLAQTNELREALPPDCVLTPHGGEFARLFPDLARRLADAGEGAPFSKIDAARGAAARAGCTVLLKGADTVIADAVGRVRVHAAAYGRAAPWLATAGSGDVLTGLICGLLARGLSPGDAAAAAAWLHVEAARSFGPGLIAEDLPDELPKVFRALARVSQKRARVSG